MLVSRRMAVVFTTISLLGSAVLSNRLQASETGVFADTLVIDVNVTGITNNQSTINSAVTNLCGQLGDLNSPTAEQIGFLSTCTVIESSANNPSELGTNLDRLASEETFAISDSLVEFSDLQTTNIFARLHTLRASPAAFAGFNFSNLRTGNYRKLYGHSQSEVFRNPVLILSQNSGSEFASRRLNYFFTGELSSGEYDAEDAQQDADVSTTGFTLGADLRITPGLVAGIGIGVLQGSTEFSRSIGEIESDGYNTTIFGTWSNQNLAYADLVLDTGSASFELERQINLLGAPEELAISDTDSRSTAISISAGKDFVRGNWEFGGYFRFSHSNSEVDGYRERTIEGNTESGLLLNISDYSIESTRLTLGAQIARIISTQRGVVIPQMRLEFETEREDRKDPVVAAFQIDPNAETVSILGEPRDSGYVNLGVGASGVFANGKSVFGYLESRLLHDQINQTWLKFGFRMDF